MNTIFCLIVLLNKQVIIILTYDRQLPKHLYQRHNKRTWRLFLHTYIFVLCAEL